LLELNYMSSWDVGYPSLLTVINQHYYTALYPYVSINRSVMGIPAGRRLYPYTTHDLTGRI
jgi:hypothetical protein